MPTDFTIDVIWMNKICAVTLANHLRAVADAFRPLSTYQRTSLWRRTEFLKATLMAGPCFHRFVHFDCVPIYIFGFHQKQCASD